MVCEVITRGETCGYSVIGGWCTCGHRQPSSPGWVKMDIEGCRSIVLDRAEAVALGTNDKNLAWSSGRYKILKVLGLEVRDKPVLRLNPRSASDHGPAKVTQPNICHACSGSGVEEDGHTACKTCHGRGVR